MRSTIPLLICCTIGLAADVQAAPQAKSVPVRPSALQKPATRALPIPALPNAPVQLELEGTEQDLLGMLKSFAQGLEKANAQSAKLPTANVFVQLLADKQLSAVLKNIRYLHLVVYDLDALRDAEEAASPSLGGSMSGSMSGTMSSGTMTGDVTMSAPGSATKPPTSLPKVPDALSFYEKPFRAEGGKRLLMANFKSTKVLMLGFNQPQGFALIVSAPSRVVVARADGYPDMEAFGRMIQFASPTQSTPIQSAKQSKPKSATPQKSLPARR